MSKSQKMILMVGLLLIGLAALFPPRFHIGDQSGIYRGFLFSGTFNQPSSINLEKLAVEWVFIASMTGFLMLSCKGNQKD